MNITLFSRALISTTLAMALLIPTFAAHSSYSHASGRSARTRYNSGNYGYGYQQGNNYSRRNRYYNPSYRNGIYGGGYAYGPKVYPDNSQIEPPFGINVGF